MPSRPPYICRCGRKVPAGHACGCRLPEVRARKAAADAKRPTAAQRGYDGKWQRERAAYLKAYPVCSRCGAPATVVNHITPHRGDRKLFWRRANWEPVCAPCHNGPIQSTERRTGHHAQRINHQ